MFTPNEIEKCGDIIKIKLLHGLFATIDAEDYDKIKGFRWYAYYDRTTRGYYCRKNIPNFGTIHLHRLIMDVSDKKMQVDHINHNTLDNRKVNLRICTQNENQKNSLLRLDNKTGFKGVSYDKNKRKYVSGIRHNNRRIHLGYFENPEDAAKAYDQKAIELFGEFKKLNLLEIC